MDATLTATDTPGVTRLRSMLSSIGTGLQVAAVVAIVMIATLTVIPLLAVWRGLVWTHRHIGQMKGTMLWVGTVVVSAFAYSYLYAQEFSAFPAGLMASAFGCALFYVIVRFGHTKLDVINQLKKGNHAIAQYFWSYALIIAVVLGAALLAAILQ